MQKSNILVYLNLTFILLLFSLCTFSQNASGTIKGTVTESMGAVIPNVKLVIEPKGVGKAIMLSSDVNGKFNATGISPGIYKINLDYHSLVYKNDNISVRPNETTKLEIKVSYEANCPVGSKGEVLQLSDSDRTEIVSSALDVTFASDPNGLLLESQKEPFVISLKTIKTEWVKKTLVRKLVLMTKDQIYAKANRSGDYLYLSFSDWQIGFNCVVVTLNNSWAVADNSEMAYLSGGGTTYVFKKENGKWVGKSIGGWIS